jgi:hypothetical protein
MDINNLKNGITFLRHYGNRSVEFILLHGGKMAGRFIFPVLLILGKEGDRTSYYPECELKSKRRIFFEHLWYMLKTGELNKYYYRFGFDRKSQTDFKTLVPWLTFTNARNRKNQLPSTPIYDPYNYVCMLRDKFVFEAFCVRVGINTPINIGMINDGFIFLLNDKKSIPIEDITQIEMSAFLKRNISCGGGMGNDVMPLRIENGLIYINNKLIKVDGFINLVGSDCWVVQKRISNQHPAISKFHSRSINTIRIVTVKTGPNIDVVTSFFRIGANGRSTDNISSGGVAVIIENGKLNKWGFQKSGIGTKIDKHPNSNITFEDYEIPYWNEIQDTVKMAHQLFYGLHSIGWDICITEKGILLIEGNDNWDTIDAQFLGQGKKNYLKYFKD